MQNPLGLFSPTRVLQGSTDATNLFQAVTSAEFVEINIRLLQLIDDFLIRAKNENNFSQICAHSSAFVAENVSRYTQERWQSLPDKSSSAVE